MRALQARRRPQRRPLRAAAAATALVLLLAPALASCHWAKPPPYNRQLHACAAAALATIPGMTGYNDAGDRWDDRTQTFAARFALYRDSDSPGHPAAWVEVACAWPLGRLDLDAPPIPDPAVVAIDGHRVRRGERYDPTTKRWTAAPRRRSPGG